MNSTLIYLCFMLVGYSTHRFRAVDGRNHPSSRSHSWASPTRCARKTFNISCSVSEKWRTDTVLSERSPDAATHYHPRLHPTWRYIHATLSKVSLCCIITSGCLPDDTLMCSHVLKTGTRFTASSHISELMLREFIQNAVVPAHPRRPPKPKSSNLAPSQIACPARPARVS